MTETVLLTEAAFDIACCRSEAMLDLRLSEDLHADRFRGSNGTRLTRVTGHRDMLAMLVRVLDATATGGDPTPGPTRACARRSARDLWGQIDAIDRGETPEHRRWRLGL